MTNIALNNEGVNPNYLNFAPRVQIPIVVPNVTIEITNYAPDVAPAGPDPTKVLLVLKNLPREYFHNSSLNCNTSKSKEYTFSVIMEGLEVPCMVGSLQILLMYAGSHAWCCGIPNSSTPIRNCQILVDGKGICFQEHSVQQRCAILFHSFR